jgi:hypothetical protein
MQVREVELPAGLSVPVALDTALDSKTASVGDPVRGRVLRDVRYSADLVLPKGAAITGHVVRLIHASPATSFTVGIELSEVEWENARARFYGELLDIDHKAAGLKQLLLYFDGSRDRAVITRDIPGVGVFYLKGSRFRISSGLPMLWRTLAPAQQPRSGSGRILE